jgi:hypothetical protein
MAFYVQSTSKKPAKHVIRTVTIFVHWLHTRQTPSTLDEWDELSIYQPKKGWTTARLLALANCHVFGDRFLAPEFCHTMNGTFTTTCFASYNPNEESCYVINYAFANPPSGMSNATDSS